MKEIKLRKKKNIKRYMGFVFSAFKKAPHSKVNHSNLKKSRIVNVILSFISKPYLFFKNIFLLLRLFYFELLYFAHLRVRYIHDILYKDNQTYKKVNDFRYTRTIRRATIWGVLLSFVVSQFLGSLWPNLFNPMHPQVAEGANTSVIWTSQNDFQNNNVVGPDFIYGNADDNTTGTSTTRSNVDTSGTPGGAKLSTTSNYGDGSDGALPTAGSLSGTFNLNTQTNTFNGRGAADGVVTTSSVGKSAGDTSVSVTLGMGIGATDEILIAKFWKVGNTTTGVSEIKTVDSIAGGGTTFNFSSGLTNSYPAGSLVQRIPNYSSMEIGATGIVTANAWDGSTGGVVIFRVQGTLTIASGGKIDTSGLGYAAISGPGKGGTSDCYDECTEGGGGGYGGAGGRGSADTDPYSYYMNFGYGGSNYASFPDFGSGGGSGRGGGLVYAYASNLNSGGSIISQGGTGGSGQGAGGGIYLMLGGISSKGSISANGTSDTGGGGGGGGGRIKIVTGSDPGATGISASGGTAVAGGGWSAQPGVATSPTYTYSAPTYNTSGTISGLKIDAGSGKKARWSSVSWSTEGLPANTEVKFRAQTSDNGTDWSGWSGYSVQDSDDSTTGSGSLAALDTSRWLGIEMTLTGGTNTPTLNDFTVDYNTLNSPDSLKQFNGADEIASGGYIGTTTPELKADLGTPFVGGSPITPAIELRTDTSFTGTPTDVGVVINESAYTCEANPCAPLGVVKIADLSGLTPGETYYWKARITDGAGRQSAWSDTYSSFTVDTTAPPAVNTLSAPDPGKTAVLNWDIVNDILSGTDYYSVYRSGDLGVLGSKITTNGAVTTGSFTDAPADGTYYYTVRAVDNAGNEQATGNDQVRVVVDNSGPGGAFALSTPADNAWTNDSTPTLSWVEATDPSGILRYELYIDDELDRNDLTDVDTTTVPLSGLSSGTHTWYIKAVDNAENATSSDVRTVSYDGSASVPSAFSATSNDAEKVVVSWTDANTGAPTSSFTLQRVRKSDYLDNNWDQDPNSDWSSGPEYASFTLSGATDLLNDSSLAPTQGQPLISLSITYAYRIKATDEAGNTTVWSDVVYGRTTDTVKPSNPSSVSAVSNGGYEVNLSWSLSTDAGSEVTGYKIYRAESNLAVEGDFTLIGYRDIDPPGSLAGNLTWVDNDANNDAIDFSETINEQPVSIKPQTSPHLNDYVDYYYRITAIDASGNESEIIPEEGFPPVPVDANLATTKTADVTAPDAPTGLTATAMGYDLGTDSQKIRVEWAASPDKTSRDSEVDGSGVLGYQVFRAGPYATETIPEENEYSSLGYTGATLYENTGMEEMRYYYYKVQAIDRAHSDTLSDIENNISALTGAVEKKTLSNAVPNPPTSVSVESAKGDPTDEDLDVGSRVDITFSGAKIKWSANKITGYKIYRSETSPSGTTPPDDDNEWLSTATLLDTNGDGLTISGLNVTGYEPPDATGDGERTYTDTVPDDAKAYYYRIISVGYNPDQSPTTVTSGLTSVVSEVGGGWDKVPDATAPSRITGVEVNDLRDGEDHYRNIITWNRISASADTNKRDGELDFKEYRIYRSTDGVLFTQILVDGENPLYRSNQNNAIDNNYYVDAISIEGAATNYYYRVVVADDAGDNFKYSNDTPVNEYDNESEPSTPVSINPSATSPTVTGVQVTSVGVSTATIKWTTNQDTDSLVEYRVAGVNDVLASGKDRVDATKSHSVKLQGLEKNTTYEYRIVSRNSLGNIDDEEADDDWNRDFKTDTFSISGNSVTPTTTTATVRWTTNRASDSYVEYKLEGSGDKYEVAGDATMTTSHEVILKALKPHSSYTYNLRSVTSDKYVATLNLENFKTRADDVNKFVISPTETNMSEKNITATTAQITWTTTLPTTSWVEYGTRSGLYSMSAGENALGTVHAVKLQNLTPGTKYYYIVKGTDESNVEYFSPESSFTAVLMPEVSNLRVQDTEPYKAVITMDTNVDALVAINYGKDSGYGQRLSKAKAERNHVIVLEGLEDNSTYHFQVSAIDQFKNEDLSEDMTFTTPLDTIGPEVSEVKVDVLPVSDSTDTASIIISWKTDKPSTTQVEYDDKATGDKYDNQTVENKNLGTNHTVFIKDLSSSTNYRFRIVAKDKRGNLTQTKAATFITPTKEKSLLQVIIKSFEDTFSWVKNVPGFFGKVKDRLLGR